MKTRIHLSFPMYSGILRNVKIKGDCNEIVKQTKKIEKLGNLSACDKLELAKKYELLLMFACMGFYKEQSPATIKKKIIIQLFDALKSGETEAEKIISYYCEVECCIDALYLKGECYEFGLGVEKNLFLAAKCYTYVLKYIHFPPSAHTDIKWEDHLQSSEIEQYKTFSTNKFFDLMKSDELSLNEKKDVIEYCFWRSYDDARAIFGNRFDKIMEENVKRNEKVSLDSADVLLDIGKKEEAFKMYRQLADAGEAIALYCLGNCYKDGIGTEKNREKSFLYYQEAKTCIEKAHNDYLKKDLSDEENKAYYNKLRSALRNTNESLVECYYYGVGTDVDYKKAVELMRGTVYSAPVVRPWYKEVPYKIRLLYAECFYYGRGVEKDHDKIIDEIFDDVMRLNGHNEANLLLGKCYYMKGDYERAFSCFDKAALDHDKVPGLPEAKLWLAECYFYNLGLFCPGTMQERYYKALCLCEMAEKAGDSNARDKAESFRKEYSEIVQKAETKFSVPTSLSDESSSSLSYDNFDAQWVEARNYINQNCPSTWSHSGMDMINNDTNLTEYQKELCLTLYRIYGD